MFCFYTSLHFYKEDQFNIAIAYFSLVFQLKFHASPTNTICLFISFFGFVVTMQMET